jgi:hypothetical protein
MEIPSISQINAVTSQKSSFQSLSNPTHYKTEFWNNFRNWCQGDEGFQGITDDGLRAAWVKFLIMAAEHGGSINFTSFDEFSITFNDEEFTAGGTINSLLQAVLEENEFSLQQFSRAFAPEIANSLKSQHHRTSYYSKYASHTQLPYWFGFPAASYIYDGGLIPTQAHRRILNQVKSRVLRDRGRTDRSHDPGLYEAALEGISGHGGPTTESAL